MAGKGGTATFGIKVDDQASGAAKNAAAALEQFRSKIDASEQSLKNLTGAQRRLRGSTDEVKAAKTQLQAQIDAEKNSISAANLALLKQGTTYDKLASDAKKLGAEKESLKKKDDELKKKSENDGLKASKDRVDNLAGAVQKAGGPLAGLASKFTSLKDTATSSGGGMALAAGAITICIAVAAKLATTLYDATASFLRFIFASSNAARAQGLMREAAQGSAEQAKNFGTQIDALARKLDTPKEKLNTLAVELARSRLTGEEIVDTFKAVGSASAAMGDDVGNTFKDIIKRGQVVQRLQINPQELWGTGVEFKDVAETLAKSLNVSVADAQKALFEGRVKLSDGAKAIKDTIDRRFGEVNAKKLLDLNTIEQKFHENLASLTRDVKTEPLARGFQTLASVFDETTVTGASLKKIITDVGNKAGDVFEKGAPIAAKFFKGMVIGVLASELAFIRLRKAWRNTFGADTTKDIDGATLAVKLGTVAVTSLAASLILAAGAGAAIAAPFVAAGKAVYDVVDAVERIEKKFETTDWKGIGKNLVGGLAKGIHDGIADVENVVTDLADSITRKFTGKMEIRSPSKKFERYGENTGEGYVVGVDKTVPEAQRATNELGAGAPASTPAASSSGSSSARSIQFVIQIDARGASKEAVQELSRMSFREQLVTQLEEMLRTAEAQTA